MTQFRQTGSKDLFITCVAREKDVLKFWGLPRNAIDIVKTYENHFQKAASKFDETSGFLSSNQLPLGVRCAVLSQIKKQWCRARVIDIVGVTEITVELMDYGNKEIVIVDNVRDLDESFFRYPAQAVECILADVLPFNKREWSTDAVRFCEEELLYQTVSCYAISEFMNVPIVRIAKKGENEPFVQRLINSALAVIKPESAKPQPHMQPSHPMQPSYPMQSLRMHPMMSQMQPIFRFKMNTLDQNTVHLVKVSHFDSVHHFHIQLAAAEVELKRLMEDIRVYVNTENVPFSNPPGINVPCLASFSSKPTYYRGLITSILQGRYQVLFVDYGYFEYKDLHELRHIPNNFLALQAQGIRCCLESNVQISAEEFLQAAKGRLLSCHVLGFNGESYIVRFKEHAQETLMQQPSTSQVMCSESLNYPRQELSINSSYPVTVSYLNDITEFYCHLTQCKEKLENISSALNSGYANHDFIELSELVLGMAVCVKFSEDNVWYRAEVKNINNEADIEVFFVDYGNYDNASVRDVCRLKPNLINIPVMAYKCRLFEVDRPSDSTLADDMFDLLEELTTGQMLTASVKGHSSESYDIVLKEENASSSINQKLLSKCCSISSVPVSSVERLYVTSFTSPDSFFAQFEKLSSSSLENMQNEINNFYVNAHNTSFIPKVGSYVCAKFEEDMQYYRAKVEDTSGTNCQVLFIDYGNRASVSFSSVHPINPKFIKEPQFGIDCSLESYPPATPVHKLESLMLENLIEARMVKEQGKKWVVTLTEDFPGNVAILELLRQHETLVPRSIHGAGLRGFQENIPQREEYKERNHYQNPRPDFPKQPKWNEHDDRVYSISPSPKTKDEESVKSFSSTSVPHNAYRNVYVSHVVSPSEFYCQIEEESGKLQTLMKNIEDRYGNLNDNELRLKNMTIGSPCCAVYQEDGLWYRGQIKQVDSKSCTVYFIDYGNTDIVPTSKVKQLDNNFFTLPSQAVSCKSYNVLPKGNTWSDAAIEDFMNMTHGKSFVAQFVESDSKNTYAVNLVSIGKLQEDVLNKELVTLGHGQLKDSTKTIVLNSHAASSNLTFQSPTVKIGSLEPVTVTYGLNPGEIFVQLKAYESGFKEMMNKLQEYYSKVSNDAIVDRPHQGMICVAQFFMDSAWYRGEIKKVDKNMLTVSYVDYGNSEKVERKNIRCITQDFTTLPIQGIKCRLKDVKPPGASWNTSQSIDKYFEGSSECRFISKNNDCYLIELFCNKKNVAEQLVRDGLASSDAPIQVKATSVVQVQPLLKRETFFVSGQLISVIVSYNQSPYKFWCQSADESDVLDQLMADIESQYLDCNVPCINATDLKIGGICMAKYSADDAWYRAEIKSKVSAEECEVFFVDYGNSEVLTIDRLAGVNNPEFLKIPPQCFECRLSGAPVNCDSKKTEEFQSIVDEAEEITAKVEKNTAGVYIVSLLYEKDGEELNISIVLFGEDQGLSALPEAVPKFLPSDVPLGAQEGYVTVINTPHDFFIQLDGCEDNLAELCDEMAEVFGAMSADESVVGNPCIGCACAAKYSEDESWYRAEIINVQETIADVLFVDYGNVSNVPIDTLKSLNQKLLSIPPYAIRCKLNGIASSAENWMQPTISAFQDMVTEHSLSVTFIIKDIPATVSISKDDKDVAQSLIELELAIVDTCPEVEEAYTDDHLVTVEDQLHSLPTDLSYPNRKLSSSNLKVKISYVDSCDKFFIMPLELNTELEAVMKTLDLLYAENQTEDGKKADIPDSLEDPSPLMSCVAKYSEDEAWYRAIITDISKNDIHVTFVDYGNSEMTSLENLRPITPELMEIPPIALECKLYGVQANEGREQEILTKLEEYYLDEVELEMEIVNKKAVYEIKLSNNRDFADMLCEEGLATAVFPTEVIESDGMCSKKPEILQMASVEVSEEQNITIPLQSPSLEEQILVSVKFYTVQEKIILYASPCNLEDELLAMQAMLQTSYNETERKVSQVKNNGFYAAKYLEDDNWYRAQVLSCDGDEIHVKFIDYGNSETVNIDNINELLPEFTSKPQFSLAFCLTGFQVIEEMKQDVVNKLDEQIYEGLVLVQLCKLNHKSPNICISDIICGESSFVEMLLNQKYLSQCYIDSFETCDKFEATVKHVIEDLIYLLPAKLVEEQNHLQDALQTVCCDLSASAEIDPLRLYVAKVNDLWSRVKISEINSSSDSALVKAVDFGVEVNVQLSQLRTLPVELCHRPVFLVLCKIVDIENAPNIIKNKDLEKINNAVFQCEVQNQNSGSPLAVKLYEQSVDAVSDCEKQMVAHDLSEMVSDKTSEPDTENQCLTDDTKLDLKSKESADKPCDGSLDGVSKAEMEDTELFENLEGNAQQTLNSEDQEAEFEFENSHEVSESQNSNIESNSDEIARSKHVSDLNAEPISTNFKENNIEDFGEEVESASAIHNLSESELDAESVSTNFKENNIEDSGEEVESASAIHTLSESDASLKGIEAALTSKSTAEGLSDSDAESTHKDSTIKISETDVQIEDSAEDLGEPPSALFSLSESDASMKYKEVALTEELESKDEVYESQDSEVEDNCEEVNDLVTREEMNVLSHVSNAEGIQSVELNEKHKSLNENDWDERPECDIKEECKGVAESESDSHPDNEQISDSIKAHDNESNIVEDNSITSEVIHASDSTLNATDFNETALDYPEADVASELSTDASEDITRVKSDPADDCQVADSAEESNIESSASLKKPSLHGLSGKIDVYIRDIAISNGSFILAVTPYECYLELENKLQKEFQEVYSAKKSGISDSSKLCAVLCDDMWCRGKILQRSDDELTVLLIDYGMCKTVSISDAKELTPVHKEIPNYAVWCTLTHLHCPTEKTSDAKHFLDTIIDTMQGTGKIVSIEVIEEEEPYKVILFHEHDNQSDNISYTLVTENLAVQQLPDINVPTGQYNVKLSHVSQESDNLIYVHLVPHLDDIKTLNISMECSYPVKDSTSPVVQSDLYYAALHNGVWMRGKAISLEGKIHLRLIDTGEIIPTNTDLCLLLPLHCLQSPFAIPCRIPDTVLKSDKIAEELGQDEFLVSIENDSESQSLYAKIEDEKLIKKLSS